MQMAQQDGQPFSFWNRTLGLITGNLSQGFSVKWWKDKHNRHHAVPNVHGSGDGLNGDPDIDTMPLLAWSIKMAETGKVSYSYSYSCMHALLPPEPWPRPVVEFYRELYVEPQTLPRTANPNPQQLLTPHPRPFLTSNFVNPQENPTARFMISIQKFSYLPLLLIARLSWLQQGIQFAWNIKEDGIFNNAVKSKDLEKLQEVRHDEQ